MSMTSVSDEVPGAARWSRLRPVWTFCRAVLSNPKAAAGAILLARHRYAHRRQQGMLCVEGEIATVAPCVVKMRLDAG